MPLLTDVIDPILARVEGCPRAFAVDALRYAAIEFCTKTMCLTTWTQATLDGSETPIFDLDVQVVDIFDARDEDDEEILVTYLNDPRLSELADDEQAIAFTDPNNLELAIPATTDAPVTLNLLMAIAPGPETAELHEDLWRRHSEALRHGALARLFAEPKKPWSDNTLSGFHEGKFQAAITMAAADAGRNREQPARRLRVRPA